MFTDDTFTAVLPADLPLDWPLDSADYAAVAGPDFPAGRSIQYSPTEDFDVQVRRIGPLAHVNGGVTPERYETTAKPRQPVILWTLPSGVMWVVPRSEAELQTLRAHMRVNEGAYGLPRVTLVSPLTPGDPVEYMGRQIHFVPAASVDFSLAGELAADTTVQDGSYHAANVATPFGIEVHCSGDSKDAAEIDARCEAIAASVAPLLR